MTPKRIETKQSRRRKAEEMALSQAPTHTDPPEILTPEKTRQTLHELRVHQIELEMQNEELRRSQLELDAARARYSDLYDMAPIGYCTISEEGILLEVNLTAAGLLGMARNELCGQPITRFILNEDQDIYYFYRQQLFATREQKACELRMVKKDGTIFWVRLEGSLSRNAPEYRCVLNDITERRAAETEGERLFDEVTRSRESLRAIGRRLVDVHEANNHALARQLHDLIGQKLTALSIHLDIIQNILPGEAVTLVLSSLDESRKLLEQTADRVRELMAELRSSVLDDYGLPAALRWYGSQMAKRTGLAITVIAEPNPRRLPGSTETALFSICQEAMANVNKHAQATQVTIRLDWGHGVCRMSVEDNGIGFKQAPVEASSKRTHWGLILMAERAETVSGQLTIQSTPGKGTVVQVEIAT